MEGMESRKPLSMEAGIRNRMHTENQTDSSVTVNYASPSGGMQISFILKEGKASFFDSTLRKPNSVEMNVATQLAQEVIDARFKQAAE